MVENEEGRGKVSGKMLDLSTSKSRVPKTWWYIAAVENSRVEMERSYDGFRVRIAEVIERL